jgi:transposase
MLSWGEGTLRRHGETEEVSRELMERAVRLVFESGRPIAHVAAHLGIHPEALRKRVRQAEADAGKRTDLLTTQEREEIRRLRRENLELRRANEILKAASVFFAKELAGHVLGGLRRWLARSNPVIMTVLLVVIGSKILGDAISGLS